MFDIWLCQIVRPNNEIHNSDPKFLVRVDALAEITDSLLEEIKKKVLRQFDTPPVGEIVVDLVEFYDDIAQL